MSSRNEPPRAVRIDEWGLTTDDYGRRRGLPLFGIFLILVGVFLALSEFFPGIAIGASAFFLVLGILLLLVWVRDRSHAALYGGVVVTALSLADLLSRVGAIHGDGWGSLFLGVGFLIVAAIRAAGQAGWGWQLVVGVILTLYGGSQVFATVAGFNPDRLVGPVLIVLLGLLLISRSTGRRQRPY